VPRGPSRQHALDHTLHGRLAASARADNGDQQRKRAVRLSRGTDGHLSQHHVTALGIAQVGPPYGPEARRDRRRGLHLDPGVIGKRQLPVAAATARALAEWFSA